MNSPSKDVPSSRGPFLAAASAIALITFVIYLPSLKNGFVDWDDFIYITENNMIRNMDLRFFKLAFTNVVNSNWHPLTMISYAVDYSLWGLDPVGYHLINIILHSINTFLAGLLAFMLVESKTGLTPSSTLFGANKTSFITGAVTGVLFGLHPVHVESVTWVSERKDVLCAFFFILALLAYLRYADHGGRRRALYYSLAIVSFVLAILSKPMAVTLPVVLLVMDFYPLDRLSGVNGAKRAIIEKVPFFFISILSAIATVWAQASSGTVKTFESFPASMRLFTSVKAFIFYLYKMLLPVSLSPCYPTPFKADFLSPGFIVSLALLLGITLFCILALKRSRIFLAVWMYYVVTLLPVVGIIQVGGLSVADRYAYLPSLSLFMLAGVGAARLFEKSSAKTVKAVVVFFIFAVSSALGVKTVSQQGVWKDSLTLWSEAIRQNPMSVPIIYTSRGLAYSALGDHEKAMEDYNTAFKINPTYAYTFVYRGVELAKMGRLEEALRDFDTAVALKPGYADAYYYRAIANFNLHAVDSAIHDLTQAITLNRGFVDAYNKRGLAYIEAGDYNRAMADLRTAISLDPGNGALYYNLGTAALKAGDAAGAEATFNRARDLGYR